MNKIPLFRIIWTLLLLQGFIPRQAVAQITTTIGAVSNACVGDTITLPVTVSMASGISVAGISMAVDFDTTKLQCLMFGTGASAQAAQNINPAIANGFLSNVTSFAYQTPNPPYNSSTRRQFRAAWFNLVPVAFNGLMFNLRFVVVSTGNSVVKWDVATPGNCEYADELADVIPNCSFVDGNISAFSTIPIITQLSGITNLSTCSGTTLSVTASGAGSFQWQELIQGSGWVNLSNGTYYSGVNTSQLVLTGIPNSFHGRQYRVLVGGCGNPVISNALTLSVTSLNATVTATRPTTFCPGDSVVLTGSQVTGGTYQWFRNAQALPGVQGPNLTATASGTYAYTVTQGACVLRSDSVVVTVHPVPQVTLTGNASLCSGGRSVLTASYVPGVSYQWLRNGTVLPNQVLASLEVSQSGLYQVRVSGGSCLSNAVQVSVSTACQGLSLGSVVACQGDTVEIPVWHNGLSGILNITMRFAYQPSQLSYLGFGQVPSALAGLQVTNTLVNPQNGWIGLNWSGGTVVSLAAGPMLKLRFVALASAQLSWDTVSSPAEILDGNLDALPLQYTGTQITVFNPFPLQVTRRIVCEGQSVTLAGLTFDSTGIYQLGSVPSTSYAVCDTPLQLELTVLPKVTYLNAGICQGQNYSFNGMSRNTSGIYWDTLNNVLGCDSMIRLTLTVNPVYMQEQRRQVCSGTCYPFGGQNRCSSGVYTHTYRSQAGCDSVVTLSLVVSDSISVTSASGVAGFCPQGFVRLRVSNLPPSVQGIWYRDGAPISGASDTVFDAALPGSYRAQFYLPSGNCSLYSNVLQVTELNCNQVSGTLRYDNNAGTPLAGVPVQLKTLLGNVVAADTTDSSGFYDMKGYPNGNYVLGASVNYVPGGINATDALFIQRGFTALITLTPLRRKAGDVNNNATTNGTDALLVQRWTTGIVTVFPAGLFAREEPSFTASGNLVPLSMRALSAGDVNGSYSIQPAPPVLVLDTVYGNGNVGTAVVRFTNPGSGVFERGIVWSSSPTPTISSNKSVAGKGGFGFTQSFGGVTVGSQYYVRAYARTSAGVYYSSERSFTLIFACGTSTVTDLDGNSYNTVLIGTQCWTQSNLKVSKYRNGDNIPTGLSNTDWENTTAGAYAVYNNALVYDTLYGKLYNHFTVTDSRGLCPTGWHVPTDGEWNVMVKFLDPNADTVCGNCVQSAIAGGALKSRAIQPTPGGWNLPNTGATNSSGFTAGPGGLRLNYGDFSYLGNYGFWWSSSLSGSGARYRVLYYDYGNIFRNYNFRTNGFSVRCLRD